jgi:hypothetical protein
MPDVPANKPSSRVESFLEKARAQASRRARLAFVIDATASREQAWDNAVQLQAQMFEEAGKVGTLAVQLIYFRGLNELSVSPWVTDTRSLADMMRKVRCESGHTKYQRALDHIRKEHGIEPIAAAVLIGDMCEEEHVALRNAALGLGVPLFVFQEGDDRNAEGIFRELAQLTGGAYDQFSPNSARKLAELLRAVAAFATGGLTALADLRSDSARKLLGQMKRDPS